MENYIVKLLTVGKITEEVENGCTKNVISHLPGFKTSVAALQYISQDESTVPDIFYLCEWGNMASRSRANKEKPSSIISLL